MTVAVGATHGKRNRMIPRRIATPELEGGQESINTLNMTITELDRYISRNILSPNRRFFDIDGAPFRIDDKVTVLNNPNKDDTFDEDFVGMTGEVFYFEYDCGCGQTFPSDPMIGIKFPDGRAEEFWKEELMLIA